MNDHFKTYKMKHILLLFYCGTVAHYIKYNIKMLIMTMTAHLHDDTKPTEGLFYKVIFVLDY